jgi:hypothetical protein
MKALLMGLETVDELLTSVALKGETIGTQYSWRMGRVIHATATIIHEVVRRLGRKLGLTSANHAFVEGMRLVNQKHDAQYPWLWPSLGYISKRAEELVDGACTLENGERLKLEEISWLRDPYRDVIGSARFSFNSLGWVADLVEQYRNSGDSHYLVPARKLTLRWISECLDTEGRARIWDDHATALRAIALCQLWCAYNETRNLDYDFVTKLLSAIVRHAEKLVHRRFYRPCHNHGVTQAYALLAIGLFFPVHPKASKWVELACARIEAQMSENVSAEGMHREHSPFYHFYVFNQFLYAYQLGEAYGIEFSQAFTDRLKKMLLCGAYLLKPNGTLPALGDTCKSSPLLVNAEDVPEWFSKARQRYLYSFSGGAAGTQPEENSIYLPHGGVTLLRSGWGTERRFEDECFLAVRTRTFDTSHIHRDQLSFELYAYGDDLIVDSGGPYGYGEPMREFFLSTAAHNTVVVDGKEQGIGKAEVIDWRTSSIFDLLVAEQRSYPGVVHRRVVLFVRPDYFLILDRLEAEDRHAYAQFLHLNPGLNARCDNLAVTTTSSTDGATVQIIPLLEPGLAVKLHQGTDHALQGWVCVGEMQKLLSTVVEYQRQGCTEEFAVLLVPQPPGISTAVRARLEELSAGGRRIHVVIGERRDEIVISNDGRVTVGGVRGVC